MSVQFNRSNIEDLIAGQGRYFAGCYDTFESFGGPCVYFHRECLKAGAADFLSNRHIEMLYATLTAWGLHRMGDADTKLAKWQMFRSSIVDQAPALEPFREFDMLRMNPVEYSAAVRRLRLAYERLRVSLSNATIVANSKTLCHLFPRFVPPIDRQYTIRFFKSAPENWLDKKGKWKTVQLPGDPVAQFNFFHDVCLGVKQIADRIDRGVFEEQSDQHGVAAPKAVDNAIVQYVKLFAASMGAETAEPCTEN